MAGAAETLFLSRLISPEVLGYVSYAVPVTTGQRCGGANASRRRDFALALLKKQRESIRVAGDAVPTYFIA